MAKGSGTGRPSFRPKFNNNRYAKRKITNDKGWYGDNWQELSEYVRRRDNYTCMAYKLDPKCRCGNRFPPPFNRLLHAHHIVPLPRGSNHPTNLISVCVTCHGKLHGKNLGTISEKQIRASKYKR